LDSYLHWLGIEQIIRRTCTRTIFKIEVQSTAVTYALTRLPRTEANTASLARLWCGHWAIENRVHDVRDVTLGEDTHQIHTGNDPQVLAALHNGSLHVLGAAGWTNIAAALRQYSWSLPAVLQLLGVSAARL
jgi:predicted transposase YbfD/YdcC